jgi:hypothetical protein
MATKQVLQPSELQNPHRLSKAQLGTILKVLGRLANLNTELARRTIRHVVDGTDDEVVLELGGQKEAGEALALASVPRTRFDWNALQHAAAERAEMFRADEKVAPAVWVRLGHVLDAVRRAAGVTAAAPPQWPTWLAALVGELIQAWNMSGAGQRKEWSWPVGELEAVLREAGLPTGLVASAFLEPRQAHGLQVGPFMYGNVVAPFGGWADYLARHLDVVRAAFAPADADGRLSLLRTLGQMDFDFTPVLDLLAEYATGPAKTVREAALPLLGAHPEQARLLLEKVLAEGDAARRHEAVGSLWRLYGHDAAETLRKHAGGESSERVKQTVERLLAAPQGSDEQVAQELAAALPPLQIELGEVPLSQEAKQGIRESLEHGYRQALKQHERAVEMYNGPNRPKWMQKPQEPVQPTPQAFEPLFAFVEGRSKDAGKVEQYLPAYSWQKGPYGDWLAPPGVHLIHLVRLEFALQRVQLNMYNQGLLWWRDQRDLEAYRGRCPQPFGLREVDAAVASLPGGKPGMMGLSYLATNTRWNSFCDWEPEAVWPLFAEQPDLLHELLAGGRRGPNPARYDYYLSEKRRNAFRVLATFPRLPPAFIPELWELALGEAKTDRPLAQAALASVPDKATKIIVALQDGRQGVRAAAAEWLGKIGDAAAVEPLKEAFRKEKQESVKGAILVALEACGADIQEFLGRDSLLEQAEAGLAKKRPKGMEWFPFDALPALHWQDTGARVDPKIVQWWVVQSVQQKSPVCGPLLRRYLAMCRPHETTALAKFVLSAWIGQDTRTPSQEESAGRARADADKQWAMYSQHQYYLDFFKNDKENLYRQLFQQYSNQFLGSAIDHKGLLALAGAAADADCVKLCEGYIRKYFGNRLAQSKALVEVLAWSPHPQAIQVLLSLANRFRTKAVRQAAEEHVRALAEREGWTIDELADRTIPDAGFERPADEQGRPVGSQATLVLDYGPRTFTVTLDDELQPVIANEEGKKIKNPPAAAKDDDPEKAKAAKKAFTDAKKTVKDVVKRQAERLYEALCTQRAWRFEDWRRYLADHPVVGRLCVRAVWAAFAGDRLLGCFRPLEDGSLTNEKDEEVNFEPDTLVRLAHTCNSPAETAAAWLQHFTDYDVEPLFAQFGRATYTLPEDKKKETDVKDFEGHQVTTFRLRGKATKLGYVRGEAEDGGWFRVYRKPFASLGVQAVLEFTGNSLPEEDRPAALESLYFTGLKQGDSSWDPAKLPLGKIPPVLLSECYNDVKQMAAEGTGYEPKWREKSYY